MNFMPSTLKKMENNRNNELKTCSLDSFMIEKFTIN